MLAADQLSEGLRVMLAADLRTVLPVPFNRQKVTAPNGVPWTADVVPAGTVGTVYAFRVAKGMPCRGMPHLLAWGVAWDGVPRHESPKNTYGLQLEQASEQQPPGLVALRARWMAALEARRAMEAQAAQELLGPSNGLGKAFWADYEAAKAWADQLRQEYDAAAGIMPREV